MFQAWMKTQGVSDINKTPKQVLIQMVMLLLQTRRFEEGIPPHGNNTIG